MTFKQISTGVLPYAPTLKQFVLPMLLLMLWGIFTGWEPASIDAVPFIGIGMAALTKDRITEKKLLGTASYPMAAVKIYAGSMVAINAFGYATPGADTAGLKVVGVAAEQVDNSAGAAGDLRIKVEAPIRARFDATSITQAMVGEPMYVVDDHTFDDVVGTNGILAGVLDEYISAAEGYLVVNSIVKAALTDVTASAAELNTNDGVVAGAATASKTVVLGAASEISGIRRKVNLAAATQTLTAAMSGEKFVGAVDAVFTLPAAAAGTKGVSYEFETGALSVGTGLSISPAAADHIRGNGLTSTDDKDLINTGATDRLGDSVRLYCDGVDGWVIEAVIGTWAKEA